MSEERTADQEQTGQRLKERLALYFGGPDGHFLNSRDGRRCLDGREFDPGFPWSGELLDTGLLKNRKVPDQPDGRVHWVCGGRPELWFGFFWWDRSGDSRPNSNSGFYVRGFNPDAITREYVSELAPEAFSFACQQWPDVIRRQAYPLVLQVIPEVSR